MWVTSSGPSVKSGEVTSLNTANDDDVHGMLFVITRINTLNQSGMYLQETFSRTLTHTGKFPQQEWHVSPRDVLL